MEAVETKTNTPQDTLADLASLRWVVEAKVIANGYAVRTKPNVFTTELTHKIRTGYSDYDGKFKKGPQLEHPVRVKIPEYWIHLRSDGFSFSFAEEPTVVRADGFGSVPQYQGTHDKEYWAVPQEPCYGRYGNAEDPRTTRTEYTQQKDWKERAIIAAVYLQCAEPHYGQTWYTTAYAYRIGLVGDEYVEKETEPVAEVPCTLFTQPYDTL